MIHFEKKYFSFLNVLFLFLCIFLFIIPQKIIAQDTIIKRNNEIIVAKIIEVRTNEMSYKIYNYQDGPLFILKKWELKSVTYGNGQKEIFDSIKAPEYHPESFPKKDLSIIISGKSYFFQTHKITEPDMLNLAKNINDKNLNLLIKHTQNIRFARKGFFAGALVLGGFGALSYAGFIPLKNPSYQPPPYGTYYGRRGARNANLSYRHTVGGYCMLAGLACGITSFIININEIKHAHLVVKLYNKIINN